MLQHVLLVSIIIIIFDLPNSKAAGHLHGTTHFLIDMITSLDGQWYGCFSFARPVTLNVLDEIVRVYICYLTN